MLNEKYPRMREHVLSNPFNLIRDGQALMEEENLQNFKNSLIRKLIDNQVLQDIESLIPYIAELNNVESVEKALNEKYEGTQINHKFYYSLA